MLEKRPKIKIFTFDGIFKFNPLQGVLFIQKYAFSNDFILKNAVSNPSALLKYKRWEGKKFATFF